MGLYRYSPEPSARMGLLWTLGLIRDAAIVEFGAMGHMLYAEKWLKQTGINNRGRIYSTHIDEKDIALGITDRLEEALDEIIKNDPPKVIFLLPSSIPEVIGIDLNSVAEELQDKYSNIPIFTLKKGGFKEGYSLGVEEALFVISKYLVKENKKSHELTYNIIGSNADISRFQADIIELKRILEEGFSMKCCSVLTSDTSVDEISNMGSANINLVLRSEGIKAAKELEKRFETPYILGKPYGYEGTNEWLKSIGQVLEIKINEEFINKELSEGAFTYNFCKQVIKFNNKNSIISVGGNADMVSGIVKFACDEIGMKKGFVWCDNKEFMTEEVPYWDESAWMRNINKDTVGIIMAKKEVLEWAGRNKSMMITRGLDTWNFNWYSSPFVGFRGAMKLCSLWLEELLKDS